jgi:ATP-dependent exoDNAse (exonuclease V) alpha subunit
MLKKNSMPKLITADFYRHNAKTVINLQRSIISSAIDYVNNVECESKEYDKQFRHYTNLPSELMIREGARVMFLTNRLFKEELCNGSIGVITKLIDENHIDVAFPINSGLNQVVVEKITTYFNINGIPAQ